MELILMLLLGLTLGLIGGFLYSKSQYAKQLEQQLQLIKSEMFSKSVPVNCQIPTSSSFPIF